MYTAEDTLMEQCKKTATTEPKHGMYHPLEKQM